MLTKETKPEASMAQCGAPFAAVGEQPAGDWVSCAP